ncbi:MAG: ATP-binding cassette domain-containing protein [Bifidobacteriaceae bacterium]|jgi:ABC-type lipoprotein export system ATPase subunit/ABC-type antimicrobial peptide transport system permease subunit|nr:ATP-binding cassette domain-containing protein [Bifidobacteriaceae bacterium]
MAFLQLKDIHKSYFLGKQEFPVLKGIDLDFDLGEFVSILGESGGGKSTLMNIIGGLDRKFDGEVLVDGQKLDHHNEKRMDKYRRETVGYIYQSYNLISHLSVLDNVLVSLDMTTLSKHRREEKAKELLTQVGLAEHIRKYPNQLSGGQKQRVAIARALASDPKIIIADEPTGALDSQNTAEVLQLLNEIAQEGRLVIAVTHSQAVADSGTRIVNLADGKIVDGHRVKPAYEARAPRRSGRIVSRPLRASSSLGMAAKHLRFNFWRNSLIVIGTAIGLFSVILFSGLGNGLSGYINEQITQVANPQMITVSRYQSSKTSDSSSDSSSSTSGAASSQSGAAGSQSGTSGAAGSQAGGGSNMGAMGAVTSTTAPRFSAAQLKKIAALKHVTSVQKGYTETGVVVQKGDDKVTLTSMSNWTNSYTKSSIIAGKAPGKGEIVLDKAGAAQKLGSSKNWKKLIGKTVTVSFASQDKDGMPVTIKFDVTVSGIAESSTGMMQISAVNTDTLISELSKKNVDTDPAQAVVKVDNYDNASAVGDKINALKDSNNKRLFSAISVASLISTVQTYVSLATTILAAIAAISLVVSALMIIVTMYMSVSARTKEIGVLRALGESKGDIRLLFIAESLIIGVASAALATVLAFVAEFAANSLLAKIADYAFIQITPGNVLTVFIIALVISLIASLLPSRHAANLNPIDALAAD